MVLDAEGDGEQIQIDAKLLKHITDAKINKFVTAIIQFSEKNTIAMRTNMIKKLHLGYDKTTQVQYKCLHL
jgi:hypothetical protein